MSRSATKPTTAKSPPRSSAAARCPGTGRPRSSPPSHPIWQTGSPICRYPSIRLRPSTWPGAQQAAPSGPLGATQGDQYPIGGDGLAQNFAGGKIFFSPATGANAVESDILAKYEALGGPGASALGFPIANEADGGLKPASRMSAFAAADKPVIFWTPDHGAFVVRGAMKAAWDKLGGATGKLGAPVGDQTANGDVITQKFTGGKISWNQAKNTFSTEPANLASALSGLQVPGQKMPAGSASNAGAGGWLNWHRWWLPAAVAAAVLLTGIAALVAWTRRRRRAARRDTGVAELSGGQEAGYDNGYEAVTESVSQWSPDVDSDLASSRLSDGYRVPLRPRTVRLPSQPVSDWMPPGRADVIDEPLSDEIESPAEFSNLHEDLDEDLDEHFDVEHFDEEHFEQEHFDEDPDAVDTAPTRIPTPSEVRGGRHAAADPEEDTTHFAAATPIVRRPANNSPTAGRSVPGARRIPRQSQRKLWPLLHAR